MDFISEKEFPKQRELLLLQMRWLLNEMEYAHSLILEGNLTEAKTTLSKEFEEKLFLRTFKIKS